MQRRDCASAKMMMLCLLLCACAKSNSNWDIDYSSVYRAGNREIDSGYQQPSVIGCVDDDLFNCQ